MKTKLPKLLYERLTSIYTPEEITHLDAAFSLSSRPVCLRVNLLKSTEKEINETLENYKIEYSKNILPYSYILPKSEERDIWKLDIYKEWKIYLQSFSSQLPVHFMELEKGMTVLDMTAAPGGKTSQISESIWSSGKVVACEFSTLRREKMEYNLKKLWCENVEIVPWDAQNLHTLYPVENFDVILFDAPCSSEWSISYEDTKFLEDWDMKHIRKNYERQKSILKNNIELLKKWWVLIYSTCTLAPEENEGIVHFLLCNFPELQIEEIPLDFPYIKKWLRKFDTYIYKTDVEKSLRIIPNEQSEGFFIAKFRKRA